MTEDITRTQNFILNNYMDTIEDKEKYKILHGLSGTIYKQKRIKYSVVFASKQGKYHPLVLLDTGKIPL